MIYFRELLKNQRFLIIAIVLFLVNLFCYIYVHHVLPYAPAEVALWHFMPRGEMMLAPTAFLYVIPLVMTWVLFILLFIFIKFIKTNKYLVYPFVVIAIFSYAYLLWSLLTIGNKFLFLAPPLISSNYTMLFIPFIFTFLLSFFITPLSIKFIKRIGAVDDPRRHKHPAMLISKVVPRGGVIPFMVAFIIGVAFFMGFPKKVLGIVLGGLLAGVVAVLDDKYDLHPNIRLLVFLPLSILIIMGLGVGFFYFNNPLGGTINLDSIIIPVEFFGSHNIVLFADIFTFFWLLWVANMINWSSGVDGQFAGVAGITALVIGLISIKVVDIDPEQAQTATLAFILAGAILGVAPYTWYPQKLMWGFGTTAVGLIIASLSVLTQAKVATAVLVLLVPTLDAVLVMVRRIMQKRLPTWGDRAHLHHFLLDKRGWSIPQIAAFYWGVTAFMGIVALFTAGRTKLLALLIIGGVVGYFLSVIHYGFFKDWRNKNK